MTPEELAKYRAEKLEMERKEDEEKKRLHNDEQAQRAAADSEMIEAVKDKMLPYLEKVKTAMGGALTVSITRDTENTISSIDLSLDGRAAMIRRYGSHLQVNIKQRRPPYDVVPYSGLRHASDISEENLGLFIKALIDT